jgi:hypothetical protein
MTIEFLEIEGCPNAPVLRLRLHNALGASGIESTVIRRDLGALALHGDPRTAYGSPTILVDGEDLFGAPAPEAGGTCCRYYPGGLPGEDEIVDTLERITGSRA